jgi:hypothetical protein
MQFTYPLASIKDFRHTGEVFSPQKRREHPALQNIKFFHFSIFVGLFCPLDPDSDPAGKNQQGSGSATLV